MTGSCKPRTLSVHEHLCVLVLPLGWAPGLPGPTHCITLIFLPRQIPHSPSEAPLVTSVLRDTHPLCQGAVQEGEAPDGGGVQTGRLRCLKGNAGGRHLGQGCQA